MNAKTQKGKRQTILISISILLVSLHTIFLYHSVRPELETGKLIQQSIRFLLTVGLLYAVYIGKQWAKLLILALFGLALSMILVSLFTLEGSIFAKLPLLVMITVFSIALYHFGFSENFKAFFEYQNNENAGNVNEE